MQRTWGNPKSDMRRSAAFGVAMMAVLFAAVGTSSAIAGGQLDGNRHPNVAMIVFYQPDGRFRCSATLVSPTVLVTAAHCTDGVRGKTIVDLRHRRADVTPRAADDTGDGLSDDRVHLGTRRLADRDTARPSRCGTASCN